MWRGCKRANQRWKELWVSDKAYKALPGQAGHTAKRLAANVGHGAWAADVGCNLTMASQWLFFW